MEIKDIIRQRREELNMTYEQLGDLVGVGKSTVRKWETGMIENMRRDNIVSLAKALNISPAILMGWEDYDLKEKNNTNLSKEEKTLLESFNKLNDLGKNKVITYTKDLMDNPKFINISTDETCATLNDAEENEPYLFAAHNDGISEETNKANIEKIKALYDKMKK